MFHRHFVKNGEFPKELAAAYGQFFLERMEGDYHDFYLPQPEEIKPWIKRARELIDEATRILDRN